MITEIANSFGNSTCARVRPDSREMNRLAWASARASHRQIVCRVGGERAELSSQACICRPTELAAHDSRLSIPARCAGVLAPATVSA